MSIEEVVLWYEKNVNYKLTKAFLNFLVKLGIVDIDVDLELLNLFLLDTFNGDFVKSDDNKFILKKNRIPIIEKHKDKKEESAVNSSFKKPPMTITKKEQQIKKFKIESLGDKKLKLIKL